MTGSPILACGTTPIDETNPLQLVDEAKLLRAENANLRKSNEQLLSCLIEAANALIRIARGNHDAS